VKSCPQLVDQAHHGAGLMLLRIPALVCFNPKFRTVVM
jgi:hypothetical protein